MFGNLTFLLLPNAAADKEKMSARVVIKAGENFLKFLI